MTQSTQPSSQPSSSHLPAPLSEPQLRAILSQLLSSGINAATLSHALSLPYSYISAIPAARTTSIATEDQLTEALHRLTWRAYEEAMRILDEGTPAMKLRVITSVQSRSLALLSAQSPHQLDDLRDELRGIFRQMTHTPNTPNDNDSPSEPFSTPSSPPSVQPQSHSLHGSSDDPEEGPDDWST